MECRVHKDNELSYLIAKEILENYFVPDPDSQKIEKLASLLAKFESNELKAANNDRYN